VDRSFSLFSSVRVKLSQRVYNMGSMDFTPKQLAASIQKEMPGFQVELFVLPHTRSFLMDAVYDEWVLIAGLVPRDFVFFFILLFLLRCLRLLTFSPSCRYADLFVAGLPQSRLDKLGVPRDWLA
jgi:hypothetical protein